MLSAWIAVQQVWSTWWRALLGAALVVGPAFLLGQCTGERHEKDRLEAASAVAVVEALETDGHAKEVASGERLADAVEVANKKEELTNAVQALPDEVPGPRRVALACARLRQQGTDTSGLPACGGPPGQTKAAAPAGGPGL